VFCLVAPNWRDRRWKNGGFGEEDYRGTAEVVSTTHPGHLPSDELVRADVMRVDPGQEADIESCRGADRVVYVLDGEADVAVDHLAGRLGRHQYLSVNLVRRWLQVEAALAMAETRAGIVPPSSAAAIAAAAERLKPDLGKLGAEVAHVGLPILPLIGVLEQACGEHGRWVHWGATTQDIMDTASVLQLREAGDILTRQVHDLGEALSVLVRDHRATVMAGRTHGQQAVPTTFGYKAAIWLHEILRHLERLDQGRSRLLVAQLGGAAGTLASLGPAAGVVRGCLAEFALTCGLIAATQGRLAREVATLSRTEIGELAEAHAEGKGASSTMPQKRNPIQAEIVSALSRLVTHEAGAAFAWMQQDNERGMGEWHLEWEYLPRVCVHTSAALAHTTGMVGGLTVDRRRMAANLALTAGAVNAEAVMMRLARDLGRQRAHDVVYEASMRAHEQGAPLARVLLADPRVTALVTSGELEILLDPASYLGQANEFADRVLRAWKERRT
jgi:3-carboxy-cis,cis-muconate cycloisomerase